jgi:uncharacterized membrane protein
MVELARGSVGQRITAMKTRADIKRIILSAAVAATMAMGLVAVIPDGATPHVSAGNGVAVQVADKGSDGQETHG